VLIVSGRVWGFDTKRPLTGVVLDVWQVDINGNYSAGSGDFKSEMFFQGDPRQDADPMFHAALAVPVTRREVNGKMAEFAVFDIVLEAENGAKKSG